MSSTSSTPEEEDEDDGETDGGEDQEKKIDDHLVITDDEDVYGVTGGETALTCVLTSAKVKKIFWYKENELQGGATQTSESTFSEDYDADIQTVTSILPVAATGLYKCKFEGNQELERSVQVYILEPIIKNEDIFQRKDKPITMTCFAPRKSTVSFFKGEEPMTTEGIDEIFEEVDTEQRDNLEWVKYEKAVEFARLDQNGFVYSCKAQFEGEQVVVDHSFTLEITDAVALTTTPDKTTYYATGTKVTITCNANLKVIGDIKWYKKKSGSAKYFDVAAEEGAIELKNDINAWNDHSYGELIIVSGKVSDSNVYQCEAEEVRSPEVAVWFYPVVVESEDVEAQEGETISMTCTAPEGATMSYYKDSKLLAADSEEAAFTKLREETSADGYKMFVYQRVIQQVKLERDGEQFKCTATLGELTVLQHTFDLSIDKIASLVVSEADKYYKAGSKVSLVCTANKKLHSGITWWVKKSEGDDEQIKAVSNSITIREVLNTDQVTESTLTYISAKEEHSGSYYCKGEERKSTNEMAITIFATKEQTTPLTVNDGVFFTITCWSYKNNFEFYRENEVFRAYTLEGEEASSGVEGDWKEKTLKMRLSKDQGGKFECVSMFDTFKVSSFVYNIEVTALGNSVITPAEGYPMKPIGDELELTCNLVAIAEVKLVWLFDEKEVDESKFTNTYKTDTSTQNSVLTLKDVQVADSGSYSCQTVNRGSGSSVDVKIFDPAEFTFEEAKLELSGTEVTFVCYGISGGTMTVQWSGKPLKLEEGMYEKKVDYSINGFQMDRYEIKRTIASLEDAGAYGCSSEAYDNTVYSLTVTLDVFTKPEIKIPEMDANGYTTSEGSDFTVTGQFGASKDISEDTKMILVLQRDGETDLERELTSLAYESNTISGAYEVKNVPPTYTGEYVLKITADNKKAESDALPLFVIAKKIEQYEESMAVGQELEVVCYTMAGYDIKYTINGEDTNAATLKLEDGSDFTDDEGIVLKTKVWKTTVTEDSDGVYRCQGFHRDVAITDTTVTFSVLVFSDEVIYRAEPFGGEVKILCYQVVQAGAYMKYYYQDELDENVAPELGEIIEKGGKQYQEYFWVLGELKEENQGKYTCESYILEEKIVSMTSELVGFTLTAPEGVLSDTGSAKVDCAYKGPSAGTIVWTVDGSTIQASSRDISTTGTSTDRTDELIVNSLTLETTLKIVKCEYEISGNYNKKVSKEVLVSYAKLSKIEDITIYTTDDVQINCDYTGSDTPKITWYDMSNPANPNPITSTDDEDAAYIVRKEEGKTRSVTLYLADLGYRAVPLSCNIEFTHSTRTELKYVNQQLTTLKRTGFEKELPANIMSLPSTITLECAWGSSDTPTSAVWRIDGDAPLIDLSETRTVGYKMITTLEVHVEAATDSTYTCIFEDEKEVTAQSTTQLHGAMLEIDQGKEFYPSMDDNTATCTLTSAGTATLAWVKGGEVVESSASQTVGKTDDKDEITLTSLKMDPSLDGVYSCQVTAYGETFSKEIEFAHTGVTISGDREITIRNSEEITLTCVAASQAKIGKIRWDVNGNRISSSKFENSPYVDFKMSSELVINPVEDALRYGSKVLDYECVAATQAGLFTDYKEITVHALVMTPPTVWALGTSWELTCTVISDISPKFVVMKKGDEEKKRWADFTLQSDTTDGGSGSESTGAKPGEEGYVVNAGTFSFREDGDDFFMTVEGSTYKDAGLYTCQLIYEDGAKSETTTTVKVRPVLSPQPEIFYTEKATVVLTCVIYNDVEAPLFGRWYYKEELVENSMSGPTYDVMYKTTHEITDPELSDAGDYRCEFGYDDDKNPSHTINTQFAKINLISPTSVTVQRGGKLELKASIYSSVKGFDMIWYFNGEEVSIAKGFTPTSKKSGDVYENTLKNPSIDATLAGEYHVEFTVDDPPVKLTSEKINVVVVGSAEETNNVNNYGGAITLTCEYQGAVKPTSVSWSYKTGALDTGKWTVKEGEFKDNAQKSSIEAASMTVADSGSYDCVFQVGDITITTTNIVKVRTISITKSGTQYITSDSWDVSVIVSSVDAPKNIFVKRGEDMIYPKLAESKDGDVRTYTLTLEYNFKKRAGSGDGVYTFEAVYKDGVSLKTDPVTIIARLALTEERDVQTILISPIDFDSIIRTCEYSGVDRPQETQWLLGDKVIQQDDNHVIEREDYSMEGIATDYFIVDSLLDIVEPTWEDGGVYTCRFTFADGNNVQVTIPKTIVLQGSGLKSCETFLDGEMELTCHFQSRETIEQIEWLRWKDPIDSSKIDTGTFTDNKITSKLRLTDADAADNGRYYCRATVTGIAKQYKIQTDIRFAKLTLFANPAAPHYAGSKTTIRCAREGRFQNIMILKDGIPVDDDDRRYKITVSSETSGEYSCIGEAINLCEVKEAYGKTETGAEFLEITPVAPQVIKQPEDTSVSSGDTALLSCIVPSVPGANTKITWFEKSDQNFIIWPNNMFDSDNSQWVSTLKIKRVEWFDVGEYKCRATYGEVELESDYASLSLVAFKTPPFDTLGILGGQAKFTCEYASTEQVVLELKTDGGDTSNAAVSMQYNEDGVGTISTGVATFTTLTTSNGAGEYYCQVKGKSFQSESAKLQVISYAVQPSDSWTVTGDTAGFTVRVERFDWPDFEVTWQKKVSTAWQDINPSDSKYRVQQAKANQWYTFVNIPNYDSASEATEWRAKLTFPNDEVEGLIGGDLISNSALVKKAGETTISLEKSDTFIGTTFTLKCTITAKERPSYLKIMFNGRRRREWESEDTMSFTFEDHVASVTVKETAKMWYSGKKIGCETTVSSQKVTAETDFYTVTKQCPTLTRNNAVVSLADLKDDSGNVIGKTATLECTTSDDVTYKPYAEPGEEPVTTAQCLFSDGKYSQKLTTCNKQTPKDYSKLDVSIFFKGFRQYCDPAYPERVANMVRIANGKMPDGSDAKNCGFPNLEFPCYDAGDCTFEIEESYCVWDVSSSGSEGIRMGSVFKLKDTISTDKTSRDDDESKYSIYRDQADNIREKYYIPRKSLFFRCAASSRRKREAFDRVIFGKKLTVGKKVIDSTDGTVSTTTTPTKSSTSTTTPTTPTTKFITELKPRVTEKHVTMAKEAHQEEVKTTVPEDVTLEELFVDENYQVEDELDLEEIDVEAIEMEIDVTVPLDLEAPSEYMVVEPDTGETQPSEPEEEPTIFKQMEETPELPRWELNVGSLILFVGLLAGVAIVIIFKIGVAMSRKQEVQVKNDYKYTQLCES